MLDRKTKLQILKAHINPLVARRIIVGFFVKKKSVLLLLLLRSTFSAANNNETMSVAYYHARLQRRNVFSRVCLSVCL